MRRGFLLAGEKPRAFEHHVDLEILPRQLGRIALGADLDAIAVHHHGIAFHGDRPREFSVRGVVARQMRVGLRVAEVVDRDELQVVLFAAFIVRAQDVAADAAVTVDRYSNAHSGTPKGFSQRKTLLTAFTTLSTVKPKYSKSLAPGADSPYRSIPTTAPSRPTYLRQ